MILSAKMKTFANLVPGLQLHDTCNAEDLTQRHLYHVISAARRDFRRPNSESPPMLGE